jgi:hypothetical protein
LCGQNDIKIQQVSLDMSGSLLKTWHIRKNICNSQALKTMSWAFQYFSMEHNTHLFSDGNWATFYGNLMNKDPGDVEQLDEHKPKALTHSGPRNSDGGVEHGPTEFRIQKVGAISLATSLIYYDSLRKGQ